VQKYNISYKDKHIYTKIISRFRNMECETKSTRSHRGDGGNAMSRRYLRYFHCFVL